MQIHLLGYSEAAVSRLLDTLQLKGYSDEIVIVQNIKVPEVLPFCPPGIRYRKVFWDQWFFEYDKQACIPAVMNPNPKKLIFDFFDKNKGVSKVNYFSLAHPSSITASTAQIDKGCFFEPGVIIASFARIGFAVYVNRGSTIGHHSVIGDFVTIGPGVHIAGHCYIGNGSQVGIGSVIFDHVKIGNNSIIGGGTVVTKDIPDNVVAWGNPCRIVKTNTDK